MIVMSISVIVVVSYLLVIIYLHELRLPSLNLEKLLGKKNSYKVLVIYPHPDDETMASGGLITRLVADPRFEVTCVSVTHGEFGDELLKLPPQTLAPIRKAEFAAAMGVLGVKDFAMWDFGDGSVKKQAEKLKTRLKLFLQEQKLDLVVTYERAGLYGHPDHIALSRVVHELARQTGAFRVLYMTLAQNLLKAIKLPVHMTDEEDQHLRQARAEFKLFVGSRGWTRYLAARQYRSQRLDHTIPLWMQMFMLPWEYYTTRYD